MRTGRTRCLRAVAASFVNVALALVLALGGVPLLPLVAYADDAPSASSAGAPGDDPQGASGESAGTGEGGEGSGTGEGGGTGSEPGEGGGSGQGESGGEPGGASSGSSEPGGTGEDQPDEADQKAAAAFEALVDALPDADKITVADGEQVKKASDAYDGLTEAQKRLVSEASLTQLKAAQEALARVQAELKADQDAADAVAALIQALPPAASVIASDKPAADAAQEAFDHLSASQKSLVAVADKEKLEAVCKAAAAAAAAEERKGASGDATDVRDPLYVDRLIIQWDKPDEHDQKHFVGDNSFVEDAYKRISVVTFGETVQLNGFYTTTEGTNIPYETAATDTELGSFDVSWRSSDESIATVTSPGGLVTPRGKNGSVTITATVADSRVCQPGVAAPTATVTIVFDGQEGRYVQKVEILDESGNNIGSDFGGVTVYTDQNAFHQLHARVTWCDVATGNTFTETTGSGEDYDANAVNTSLTWNASTSTAITINEDTGRLRTYTYAGIAYITCKATGGLGGVEVIDTANVQLDTGVYEYKPAESLELKVVWEERPDEVVKEATYTFDQLMELLPSQHVNATVVNASRFGTISADGFLFKDVANLVAVDDADVLQYRFTTADGYDNPVSYQYLFDSGNRYYFPNYDLGGSRADGQIVPPLLAYRSALEWNTVQVSPDAVLDDANRFRLVFGCLASGDANTSFQIYYIQGITVVLKGAPSAGRQDADRTEQSEKEGPAPSAEAADPPETDQFSDTSSSPEAPDPSDSPNSSDASKTPETQEPDDTKSPRRTTARTNNAPQPGDAAFDAREDGTGSGDEGARPAGSDESSDVFGQGEGTSGSGFGDAKKWRVYQMMNKNNSDVPDWDDDNPLSPFAMPLALGTFAAGAGITGVGFKRRLK